MDDNFLDDDETPVNVGPNPLDCEDPAQLTENASGQVLTFETVGNSDVSAVRSLNEVIQGRRTKIDVVRDSEVSVVELSLIHI